MSGLTTGPASRPGAAHKPCASSRDGRLHVHAHAAATGRGGSGSSSSSRSEAARASQRRPAAGQRRQGQQPKSGGLLSAEELLEDDEQHDQLDWLVPPTRSGAAGGRSGAASQPTPIAPGKSFQPVQSLTSRPFQRQFGAAAGVQGPAASAAALERAEVVQSPPSRPFRREGQPATQVPSATSTSQPDEPDLTQLLSSCTSAFQLLFILQRHTQTSTLNPAAACCAAACLIKMRKAAAAALAAAPPDQPGSRDGSAEAADVAATSAELQQRWQEAQALHGCDLETLMEALGPTPSTPTPHFHRRQLQDVDVAAAWLASQLSFDLLRGCRVKKLAFTTWALAKLRPGDTQLPPLIAEAICELATTQRAAGSTSGAPSWNNTQDSRSSSGSRGGSKVGGYGEEGGDAGAVGNCVIGSRLFGAPLHSLSCLLWALATWQYRAGPAAVRAVSALAEVLYRRASSAGPQDVSVSLWSLAQLYAPPAGTLSGRQHGLGGAGNQQGFEGFHQLGTPAYNAAHQPLAGRQQHPGAQVWDNNQQQASTAMEQRTGHQRLGDAADPDPKDQQQGSWRVDTDTDGGTAYEEVGGGMPVCRRAAAALALRALEIDSEARSEAKSADRPVAESGSSGGSHGGGKGSGRSGVLKQSFAAWGSDGLQEGWSVSSSSSSYSSAANSRRGGDVQAARSARQGSSRDERRRQPLNATATAAAPAEAASLLGFTPQGLANMVWGLGKLCMLGRGTGGLDQLPGLDSNLNLNASRQITQQQGQGQGQSLGQGQSQGQGQGQGRTGQGQVPSQGQSQGQRQGQGQSQGMGQGQGRQAELEKASLRATLRVCRRLLAAMGGGGSSESGAAVVAARAAVLGRFQPRELSGLLVGLAQLKGLAADGAYLEANGGSGNRGDRGDSGSGSSGSGSSVYPSSGSGSSGSGSSGSSGNGGNSGSGGSGSDRPGGHNVAAAAAEDREELRKLSAATAQVARAFARAVAAWAAGQPLWLWPPQAVANTLWAVVSLEAPCGALVQAVEAAVEAGAFDQGRRPGQERLDFAFDGTRAQSVGGVLQQQEGQTAAGVQRSFQRAGMQRAPEAGRGQDNRWIGRQGAARPAVPAPAAAAAAEDSGLQVSHGGALRFSTQEAAQLLWALAAAVDRGLTSPPAAPSRHQDANLLPPPPSPAYPGLPADTTAPVILAQNDVSVSAPGDSAPPGSVSGRHRRRRLSSNQGTTQIATRQPAAPSENDTAHELSTAAPVLPSPAAMSRLAEAVAGGMHEMDAQGIGMVAWACSRSIKGAAARALGQGTGEFAGARVLEQGAEVTGAGTAAQGGKHASAAASDSHSAPFDELPVAAVAAAAATPVLHDRGPSAAAAVVAVPPARITADAVAGSYAEPAQDSPWLASCSDGPAVQAPFLAAGSSQVATVATSPSTPSRHHGATQEDAKYTMRVQVGSVRPDPEPVPVPLVPREAAGKVLTAACVRLLSGSRGVAEFGPGPVAAVLGTIAARGFALELSGDGSDGGAVGGGGRAAVRGAAGGVAGRDGRAAGGRAAKDAQAADGGVGGGSEGSSLPRRQASLVAELLGSCAEAAPQLCSAASPRELAALAAAAAALGETRRRFWGAVAAASARPGFLFSKGLDGTAGELLAGLMASFATAGFRCTHLLPAAARLLAPSPAARALPAHRFLTPPASSAQLPSPRSRPDTNALLPPNQPTASSLSRGPSATPPMSPSRQLRPAPLHQILVAAAVSNTYHPRLFSALCAKLLRYRPADVPPERLAVRLWSLATVRHYDPQVIEQACAALSMLYVPNRRLQGGAAARAAAEAGTAARAETGAAAGAGVPGAAAAAGLDVRGAAEAGGRTAGTGAAAGHGASAAAAAGKGMGSVTDTRVSNAMAAAEEPLMKAELLEPQHLVNLTWAVGFLGAGVFKQWRPPMRALVACAPGLTNDQAIVLLWSLAVQQHMLLGPGESSTSTSAGSRDSASSRGSAGRKALRTRDSSMGSGLGAGQGRGSRRALPRRSPAPAAAIEGATDDAERLLQVLVRRLCRLRPAAARQLPLGVRYAGAEALAWLLAGPAGREVQRQVQSTMGAGLKAVLQASWSGGGGDDSSRGNAAASRGSSGAATQRARGLPGGRTGLGRRLRLGPGQTGGIPQKAGEAGGGGLPPTMRGVLRVLRAMGHATALPPPSHPHFPLVPSQGRGLGHGVVLLPCLRLILLLAGPESFARNRQPGPATDRAAGKGMAATGPGTAGAGAGWRSVEPLGPLFTQLQLLQGFYGVRAAVLDLRAWSELQGLASRRMFLLRLLRRDSGSSRSKAPAGVGADSGTTGRGHMLLSKARTIRLRVGCR